MLKTDRENTYLLLKVPAEWINITIEDAIRNKLHTPKKMIHYWRMQKNVLLNGIQTPWTTLLSVEDTLYLPIYEREEGSPIPFRHSLSILFEDDDVLVVNKPAGMNTHPVTVEDSRSLVNAVSFYLNSNETGIKPRHIHRLDKDTTGAVLFAKHGYAGAILDGYLAEGAIHRTYAALVHGIIKLDNGTIRKKIGQDRHANKMRVSSTGKEAITHYQVITRWPDKQQTIVHCHLETGRTHQIRVHMSDLGHPLVGDTLYGGNPLIDRQALHAYRLQFPHPITRKEIICTSEVPFLQ